ncbi:unnamed protein product [Phytomonas sp. EM1]|nr:unnamed protein product [Phytomonas sp. EM1]|eukprot:CCW63192.1 unnamed protein product [Phytomonas sp. isolate EM1]
MNDTLQSSRDVRVIIENSIVAEIGACTVGRCPNPSTSGYVHSHLSALMTRDSTWCIPDVIPVGDLVWPAPLVSAWKKMNYSSFTGIFPSISRVWLVVDNRLILCNYRSERELCQYDEIPELIVTVGNPVRPQKGIFQPHVSFVLPVATSEVVYLLGVCIGNEEELSEVRLLNLGYSVMAPSLFTKIIGIEEAGRIFCAGADGNLYELRYVRESTPFIPRIRLVCYSFFLSKWPVLGQITSLIGTVKQTWTGPKAGLCDIIVDRRHDLLFSLDEQSVISIWRILPNDLKFIKALAHQPSNYLPSNTFHAQLLSPLCKLFVIDPDHDGCTLTAITVSGEQFRYRYTDHFTGNQSVEFILRGYVPSHCKASREVGVCYGSGSVVILSNASENSADELVIISSPNAIMEPHSKSRNIVTTFDSSESRIVRVDAIEMISPVRPYMSPNDLCAQVNHPPSMFAVVHRHGISFFLQMRPVDLLYTIMSMSDMKNRDGLLQRFASIYSEVDYTAMLLQIATNAVNISHFICGPLIADNLNKPPAGTISTSAQASGLTFAHIGATLLNCSSPAPKRIARELLRSAALTTTQSNPPDASGMRQVTILLSTYSSTVVVYMARALYDVWDVPLHKLLQENLKTIEIVFSLLVRFLESTELATCSEEGLRIDIPYRWEINKVVVSLPAGTTLSLYDVNKFQMVMLFQAYQLARKALQTALLLHQSLFLPLRSEDHLLTFGQIVRDEMVARRMGQYYSQLILSSPQGVGSAASKQVRSFGELQKRCPYFFASIDTQELKAQSEIAELTRGGGLDSLTVSQLDQWMASVGPHAGSYWLSGALQTICQQLKDLKREDLAIHLLLHAARQLDPSNASLPLYLAEQSGRLVQENVSTALYTLYQTKCRALQLVVSILESAWLSHRSVIDILLGSPHKSGAIWELEPNDEFAHYYLLDWMRAPREDSNITQALRDTLVAARSPFLEKYLTQNSALLGEEYAHYLHRTKHDYKAAIEHSVLLAQSPLLQIPRADRLSYRIRCLNEARECACECGSGQIQQIEQLLSLLDAQKRLLKIVTDYVGSGQSQLDKTWHVGGRMVTERELALTHVEQLSESVCSVSEILQIGGMYAAYGGAEVQLDVLVSSNVSDSCVFAMCILRAYQLRDDSIEDLTRRLIERYYKRSVLFPVPTVIQVLEAYYYVKFPQGCLSAAKLLLEFGVDVKVLFYSYQDLIEERYQDAAMCEAFTQAGVTTAYLVHSLAFVLYEMAKAVQRGTLRFTVVAQAMRVVQDYISLCVSSQTIGSTERHALSEAENHLRLSDNMINAG